MASKSEKRIARQQLKLEDELKKKARQASAPSLSKTPSILSVSTNKTVPSTPLREYDMLMEHSSLHEDRQGTWSWGQERDWGEWEWNNTLLPFLRACCKKQWREIDSEFTAGKKKHIFYPRGTVIREARKRLVELEKDDLEDRLFRFRLNNINRLYGFRIQHVFYTLWWDPDHRICPSRK